MKQLIEGFVTVFLVILSALVLVQFIGATMQIRNARQFHAVCIGEIESSDFDSGVISLCEAKAKEKGYKLTVHYMKNEELVCRNCNSLVEESVAFCEQCNLATYVAYDKERLCEIWLEYRIDMAFVKLEKEGVLKGFAR